MQQKKHLKQNKITPHSRRIKKKKKKKKKELSYEWTWYYGQRTGIEDTNI